MADLDDRSRGQVILIAGFALAVTFVALALVLNSVIYTENLATRSEASKASDAVKIRTDMVSGTERLIEYINQHNTSESGTYDELETILRQGIGNMSTMTRNHHVRNSQVANASLVDIEEGTWIKQTSPRNFTNRTGATGSGDQNAETWNPVNDEGGVRAFRIHVTDPSELVDTSNADSGVADRFGVIATNNSESTSWWLDIYHDDAGNLNGNDVYAVEVTDWDGTTRTCTVNATSNSEFWVNVSRGTVGGEDCTDLNFNDDGLVVDEVTYDEAENITGTYRMLVNEEKLDMETAVTPWERFGSSSDQPFLERALYTAEISVTYATSRMVYETNVELDPTRRPSSELQEYLDNDWVRYDGDLVFAHDESPGAQTFHEVNWDVGTGDGSNEIGNSLDFITIKYSDSSPPSPLADMSNVDHEDVRIYIDRDDDRELEVNATDELEPSEPDPASGQKISFELGNGPTIQERDTVIVVFRDAVNPGSDDTNVQVEINGNAIGSGDQTQNGVLEIDD